MGKIIQIIQGEKIIYGLDDNGVVWKMVWAGKSHAGRDQFKWVKVIDSPNHE